MNKPKQAAIALAKNYLAPLLINEMYGWDAFQIGMIMNCFWVGLANGGYHDAQLIHDVCILLKDAQQKQHYRESENLMLAERIEEVKRELRKRKMLETFWGEKQDQSGNPGN